MTLASLLSNHNLSFPLEYPRAGCGLLNISSRCFSTRLAWWSRFLIRDTCFRADSRDKEEECICRFEAAAQVVEK